MNEEDKPASPGEGNEKFQVKHTSDVPVWSILPSYHMYRSTVYKSLNVSDEDLTEPPKYEDSSTSSILSSNSLQVSNASPSTSVVVPRTSSSESQTTLNSNRNLIIADETTSSWQETVLNNVHKLKNLTNTANKVSNSVKITVHYTAEVGEAGKIPTLINPSIHEYKQGDLLNGYVLIKNESDLPIPFDMFYVVFEGTFMISNVNNIGDKTPIKIRKLLEMFDFSASWNQANINRLFTEESSPYYCPNIRDPIDNSYLSFSSKRLLWPNITYKRFFTFKIPENLLDSECNEHNLSRHVELPPTLGISRFERSLSSTGNNNHNSTLVKDFSFVDSSISYSVLARFIGRRSKYKVDEDLKDIDATKLINSEGDEYIILKESNNFIRIVQESKKLTKNEKLMKLTETNLLYNNLINRIKEKIEMGQELLKSIDENNFESTVNISKRLSETELEFAKSQQLYRRNVARDIKVSDEKSIENYELYFPLTKSSLTGSVKSIGTIKLLTPKVDYNIKYISPPQFRSEPIKLEDEESWKLNVPINISLIIPELIKNNKKIPEIKSITAEFVALTLKSEKYPIPIEFHHDLLYSNKPVKRSKNTFVDQDNFDNNVKKPFQKLSTELYQIFTALGIENFKVEAQLIEDLKSVCKIQEKYINLEINNLSLDANGNQISVDAKSLASVPWTINENKFEYSKQFNLLVDLRMMNLKSKFSPSNSIIKSFDKFCFVPDFQSCFMSRFYYLKISLNFSNNETINVKLPVTVEK